MRWNKKKKGKRYSICERLAYKEKVFKTCAVARLENTCTNLHMNRYASFFKGCHIKNTIVDWYSVIAPVYSSIFEGMDEK